MLRRSAGYCSHCFIFHVLPVVQNLHVDANVELVARVCNPSPEKRPLFSWIRLIFIERRDKFCFSSYHQSVAILLLPFI
jgi:hypothetical protein